MTSVLPSHPTLSSMRPLPSSTVLLLRDRPAGLEVLMVRRSRSAVFGGMYVFPGGVVDPVDRSSLATEATVGVETGHNGWKTAGLRETAEEVGIYLTDRPVALPGRPLRGEDVYRWVLGRGARFDARRLLYLSNWITPRPARQRFDARFYVAGVEGSEEISLAASELTEGVWIRPADALDRFRTGDWDMILPTEKNLERLLEFSDSRQACRSIGQTGDPPAVRPRIVLREHGLDALLPGDPGYEEAG